MRIVTRPLATYRDGFRFFYWSFIVRAGKARGSRLGVVWKRETRDVVATFGLWAISVMRAGTVGKGMLGKVVEGEKKR